MTGLVELAGRLDREANRVRGRAAHFEEQGQSKLAARELQLELGLRMVAHVVAARTRRLPRSPESGPVASEQVG
jgi:hypothetical protein